MSGERLKIAVTGASGFVGVPVCRELTAAGHQVRAIVRSASPPSHLEGLDVITGCDLEQHEALPAILRGVDAIVHLAARAHVMDDDPQRSEALYQRANVHVMQGLASAAIAQGVKRFVFVSSIKVNGERTGANPFTPQDTPAPEDAYGRSKLAAENLLRDIAGTRMEFAIVRPPLLYGPRMRGNMLRLFQLVQRGVPLPFGSVANARDMLFVGSLARLVETLTHHPGAQGGTFLARDGMPLSTPRLIELAASVLGRKARCFPFPVRAIRRVASLAGAEATVGRLLDDLRVDDTATWRDLGWQPHLSVEDAFQETARWFRGGHQ